ncbi:MAG: exosortase/archaeosortase family protein [Pirellulales bacterium]|nr:exosortase/archaeosortase family protein [Pirellulales bacterium]
MTTPEIDSKSKNTLIISSSILLVLVVVVYYPVLYWLVKAHWWSNPDYIYGFLVPVFSGYLLWDRRDMLKLNQLNGSYWGILIILVTFVVAVYADSQYNKVLKGMTIVPMVGGMVLLVGGWHAIQWSWPAVGFLFFMSPLPGRFANLLSEELQAIGTSVSVFVLQTIGLPAVAEGNVIVLSNSRLGVVEACSGIRMLMLFFAACIGTAFYLRHRDPLTRILIALSAPPIAIIANVTRITVTAILYEKVSQELGDKIFHDLAGWLMMPMAIAILWLETALLDRLFVAPEREAPIGLGTTAGVSIPRSKDQTPPLGNVPPGRLDG